MAGIIRRPGTSYQQHNRKVIEFSMKGPVYLHQTPRSHGPKCALIDLYFSSPKQVGEIQFRNYYAASVTVLVRSEKHYKTNVAQTSYESEMNRKKDKAKPKMEEIVTLDDVLYCPVEKGSELKYQLDSGTKIFKSSSEKSSLFLSSQENVNTNSKLATDTTATNNTSKQPIETSSSVQALGNKTSNTLDCQEKSSTPSKEVLTSIFNLGDLSIALTSSTSSLSDVLDYYLVDGWVMAVDKRTLMPISSKEQGSQDRVSIAATESIVQWQDLIAIRLMLHQPADIWRSFHIEEINLFEDLPRRVPRPQHTHTDQCDPSCQDFDGLLAVLRFQTIAALHWTPECEQRNYPVPNGYEFTCLLPNWL